MVITRAGECPDKNWANMRYVHAFADVGSSSANGQWTAMHDCAKEGLGFRITTTKDVRVSENGRIVPVEATVARKEFTRALVFNPLAATFSGIAAVLGMFMYAIDTSLCLSLVSSSPSASLWQTVSWLTLAQCTYILSAISTSFAWIAFAINIAITLRSRSKVDEFATGPDQHVSLRIGPTSWIALGGAVSCCCAPSGSPWSSLTPEIALSIGLSVWTIVYLRTPRRCDTVRVTYRGEKGSGSQDSTYSTRRSTPYSSRRGSSV